MLREATRPLPDEAPGGFADATGAEIEKAGTTNTPASYVSFMKRKTYWKGDANSQAESGDWRSMAQLRYNWAGGNLRDLSHVSYN